MAFQVVDKTLRFSHLAADLPLPITLGKSARGAQSLELDTGKLYEFDGTGTWSQIDGPSGPVTPAVLSAGSAIIGKVGIDQTTPGTTDKVSIINGQNGVAGGSGAAGATTQRVIHASDDPLVALFPATGALADATANPTLTKIQSFLQAYAPNGSSSNWDRARTPTVFKASGLVTASGNTALWTPTSGKKFRLMRVLFFIYGASNVAGGGAVTCKLQDATTDIGISVVTLIPAAAATDLRLPTTGWIDLGNGYLSAAANNVLNVNLSATISGGYGVIACGTEE